MQPLQIPRKLRPDPIRPIYMPNSPEVILATGQQTEDQQARALYYFMYMTGCRINEATDFSSSRLSKFEENYQIRLKTLKARSAFRKFREVIIPRGKNCLCHEDKMWNDISPYLDQFNAFSYPFKKWKNMSEYVARKCPPLDCEAQVNVRGTWEMKMVHKRQHPHFLRHCRATHLVLYYDFDPLTLCKFMGWARLDLAMRYSHVRDFKSYMIKHEVPTDTEMLKKYEAWAKASMVKGY